jgi:hypothetical protein
MVIKTVIERMRRGRGLRAAPELLGVPPSLPSVALGARGGVVDAGYRLGVGDELVEVAAQNPDAPANCRRSG